MFENSMDTSREAASKILSLMVGVVIDVKNLLGSIFRNNTR